MMRSAGSWLARTGVGPHFFGVQRARAGLTLVELVIVMAILGILGVVIVSTTSGTSASQQSDQERINEVANELDILARAIAFFEPTKPKFSFKQTVGVYPSRLSHLTEPITPSKQNSCGQNYTSGQANLWLGGYYTREIPTTGLFVAPGFVTSDTLFRTPPTFPVPQGPYHGTLAIKIPNVTLADARLLGLTVDGDSTGTVGTVRYTPQNGTSPVIVNYLISVGDC